MAENCLTHLKMLGTRVSQLTREKVCDTPMSHDQGRLKTCWTVGRNELMWIT